MMGDCCIGEVEQYKYLGITIEGGKHGGFKSMGDWKGRMDDNDC